MRLAIRPHAEPQNPSNREENEDGQTTTEEDRLPRFRVRSHNPSLDMQKPPVGAQPAASSTTLDRAANFVASNYN